MNHFYSGKQISKLLQTCRIGCDADGWMILPNKEPSYPHYFHALSPAEISAVKVTGDVEIGYIGFGSKGYYNYNCSQMIYIFSRSLWSHATIISFWGKTETFFFFFRSAARPSSWVQLDLCLSWGRGWNNTVCYYVFKSTYSRCSIMIGLPLRLSWPHVSLTGFLIPQTGRYLTVSSVSRTHSHRSWFTR